MRAYYTDSYTAEFTAPITEVTQQDGQPAVVLRHTYFYPASGGQPADRGWLGETAVVDVQIRPSDGAILHLLAADWQGGELAHGRLDWPRRWDLMQQHTGQHILSQAFLRTAEAETIGFHLNETTCTIDLDRANLSEADLATAEALANETVWRNLPVRAHLVDWARLDEFPLRKRPPKDYAQLRLIEIGDFDLSACGGTHVAHTGEVGLIKLVKREKRGDKLRLEFLCGGRAVADYGRQLAIMGGLIAELTTAAEGLLPNIQKLRGENKQLQRQLKAAQEQLLGFEAEALSSQFVPTATGDSLLTAVLPHKTPADLRQLATALTAVPPRIALLATVGEAGATGFLLFKRHPQAGGDMAALLKAALGELGVQAGGGTAVQAQGGGFTASAEQVAAVLNSLI